MTAVDELPTDAALQEDRASTKSALLPYRHPNHDLFICDVFDAIPKDDMASMEHPIFSLATRADTRILRYEHRNVVVEIAPSVRGLATIHDKDILIYCASQLMAKKNAGEPLAQTLHLNAHELLVWTNRETSGDAYRRLKEAFDRLRGTTITTNIKTNGEDEVQGFGLIESFRIVHQTKSGRMSELEVKLSDWFYRIIQGSEVLTLSRDYFRLRKPIERRVYELARKHCGEQDEWKIGLELLHKKTGASSHYREFKSMIRQLVQDDHLPDYKVTLDDEMVIFTNRMNWQPAKPEVSYPVLDPEAYHDAKLVAPGYDVYYLEQEWRDWWVDSGMPDLGSPGKAFVGFCKRRHQMRPMGQVQTQTAIASVAGVQPTPLPLQEKIKKTVEFMRESGASEADIETFIKSQAGA